MENQAIDKNTMSKEIHWFVQTLKNSFQVIVAIEDIAVEATELGLDEVGDFFVPSELFDIAPETLLYEIMIVDDEKKNNEWIGAIAFYPNIPDWCLQVITKNGEMVLRNVLPFIE
jgi:hypothetical protein